MNVALWIVQGLLAFAFIAAGTMKLFAYEKYKIQLEKNGPTGITSGLTIFIGIVLPMATNIAPWFSPWAAVGLATIMLLAIDFHVRRYEPPVAPTILFFWQRLSRSGAFSTGRERGSDAAVAGSAR